MRGHAAQGQAEKGPSGSHPAAIMASAEPLALILIFSGHPGDTSHWNKRRERQLLSSVRHIVGLTVCSLFMVPFLCFHLKTTSQQSLFHSLIFISSSQGIVQFIWRRKTRLMPSLWTPSPLLALPFISARSLICLCASSFSPCQSTRRAIYVPLPVSVSESGLRSSRGEMCWCISKQGVTRRTNVCPAARQSNLATICFGNGPLNNNR